MDALDVDYALNVDGGGSSAMMFNGSYKIGPGRSLPNAIVVARQ
jgi:exopolysaccharide biosynthesis protein